MSSLLQEMRLAVGFKKQAALGTALVAADCWSLRTTNPDLPQAVFNNEDDADDLGKGVYATQLFKSHRSAGFPMNGRLSSEWGAMLAGFGLGNATKSAAGSGFKYTCIAPNFATAGLDMPSTTIVGAIRQGGSAITDAALIGCCCEEWGIELKSGPGRDNALFTSQWIGSGKDANPSTITLPAIYAEHALNAGALTGITLIGINYLSSARFVSLNFGWKNNIRTESAYHPGSGSQSGYQIAGRMRRGKPVPTLSYVVEAVTGSSEESNLTGQTEGTGVVTLEGALIGAGPEKHTFKITFHRLVTKAAPIGEADGITTYQVEAAILEHSSNGVLTVEATCEQDNILVAAA